MGEVPRSGKRGAVGSFELFPFNEPHPLSQAVRPASSPIGEPRIVRIRPGFHKDMGAYCKTPLRLAKSRLTAVARLHGACGRTSQPLRAASSPIGEPSPTSPERGGRRIAPEGSAAVRRIPIGMHQGEFAQTPCCPLWGWCSAPLLPPLGWCSAQRIKIVMIAGGNHTSVSCREAAKGVPLVILSCCHSSNNTPSATR